MSRFDRTYRVECGDATILPPVHMTAEVVRNAEEDPNQSKVRLWNLRESTRRGLEKLDEKLHLYAGYAEERGALLCALGNVVDAYSYTDGPDTVTQIHFMDGYANIRDTSVTLAYGEGCKASQLCKDIAGQMGLDLRMADGVPDRTWAHGFSFYGAAREALHKIVQGAGLEWSIQLGVLQIVKKLKPTTREGFVLNAGSGLIGHPERTRRGAREKATVKDQNSGDNKTIVSSRQQIDGWRVQSLLLPTINPGDKIKLESEAVQGWFRIASIRHTLDWGGGGDWVSEIEVEDTL